MDKVRTARCLVLQYLESCSSEDPEHAEEYSVSIECLKTIWTIDNATISYPGVRTLLDLIPEPAYDRERAIQLKLEGNNALKAGDLGTALAKYTEAISVDPTEPTFFCNRAAVHSRQSNHSSAIEDCERAIALDPKYATAYSRLGFAYFSLDQRDKAREAYERGIRACPENQALRDNLKSLGPAPAAGPGDGPDLAAMFGNNPMFAGLAERLKSPEVQAVLQEPEMAALIAEVQANPASLMSRFGDPRVQRLFGLVMGGGPHP